MSAWDQIQTLLTTLVVASLTWASSVLMPGSSPSEGPLLTSDSTNAFMIGWAQQGDQPPIEQVGEDSGGDVETLDAGAPVADTTVAADQETLDAGAVTTSVDDVETLDQGAPTTATEQPVETVSAAPVATTVTTTHVEPRPVATSGPVIPEGFGTGQVQALAGRAEAPVGIAGCHVGAVTGRAYVGIDCGEHEGTSFVGHARSFDDFPFVLEANFPFEGDEAFFTESNFPFNDDAEVAAAGASDDDAETGVFVSARGGAREQRDDEAEAPVVETAGNGSVQFAQRARDRDGRVRVDDRSRGRKDRQQDPDAETGVRQQSSADRSDVNRKGNKEKRTTSAEKKEKHSAQSTKDKKSGEERNTKKNRRDRGKN